MLMLKAAALFVTGIAALQCLIAERALKVEHGLKVEKYVAEIRVVSSGANAREPRIQQGRCD
jgi:hypothetical protein